MSLALSDGRVGTLRSASVSSVDRSVAKDAPGRYRVSVRISKRIAPSAKTSWRVSKVWRPAPNCSGAMYAGVPTMSWAAVAIFGDRGAEPTAVDVHVRVAAQLREAPVEDVHLAEVAEHDVARLEVAVDDASRVRELDREADLTKRSEQLVPREASQVVRVALAEALEHVRQGLASDALHREERRPVRPPAEVVDRHDRRVLELPLHARLADEQRLRSFGADLRQQRLSGDVATDAVVKLKNDLPHASGAEQRPRFVARRVRFDRDRRACSDVPLPPFAADARKDRRSFHAHQRNTVATADTLSGGQPGEGQRADKLSLEHVRASQITEKNAGDEAGAAFA